MYNTTFHLPLKGYTDPNQTGTETIKNINTLISRLPQRSTDRLRAAQWARKLKQTDSQSAIRDQYAQVLFIQLSDNRLSHPFTEQPPTQPLQPLGESKIRIPIHSSIHSFYCFAFSLFKTTSSYPTFHYTPWVVTELRTASLHSKA